MELKIASIFYTYRVSLKKGTFLVFVSFRF